MHLNLQLLLLQVFIFAALCDLSVRIDSTNDSTGQSTNHIFYFYFKQQTVPVNSKIVLNYDLNWDLTSVTGGSGNDFCENSCTLGNVNTVINGVSITLQNLFTSAISGSFVIRYTLNNLKNPMNAQQPSIFIEIQDNTGLLNFAIAQLTIQPVQVICNVQSRTNAEVSETADYTFQVDVSSTNIILPTDTYLKMVFPILWSNSAGGEIIGSTISCSSSSSPSLSCSKQNQREVKVIDILSSPSNSPFQFTITDILNPGSLQPNSQLYFQIYGNGSEPAGRCSLEIVGSTKKSISDLSFSTDSSTISDSSIMQIVFTLPVIPKTTDSVRISLPNDYSLQSLRVVTKTINSQTSSLSLDVFINSPTLTTHQIQLYPFDLNAIATYTLVFYDIQLPISAITTNTISLGIYRYGYLVADSVCCSISYNPINQGSLAISLIDNTVGASTSYHIILGQIKVLGFFQLILQFDSSYSLGNAAYSCSIIGVQSILYPQCNRINSSSISITNIDDIQNFELASFSILLQGIENPVTLSTLTITVKTLDSNSYQMQILSGTYNLVATILSGTSITINFPITLTSSDYQFRINNTNMIPINSNIILTFPRTTVITAQTKCYINQAQQTSAIINIGLSTINIPLSNTNSISSNNLLNNNFTITNIINSATICDKNQFTVSISESGNILQQKNSGILGTISNVFTSFDDLSIIISDVTTFTKNDYFIEYTLPLDISVQYPGQYSSIFIQIQFPDQFSIISCPICTSLSPLIIPITFSPLTNTLGPIQIQNPYFISISDNIIVSLYIDNCLSISQIYTSLKIFSPHQITFSQNSINTFLQEQSDQLITISSDIPQIVDSVHVKVPSQYQIRSTGGILIQTSYSSATINVISSGSTLTQVVISDIPFLESLSISIIGLLNPASSPGSNSWAIQFYSSGNILISQSSSAILFSSECTFPCRSCANDPTQCLTCYNISGSAFPILRASTCTTSCLTNQFQIDNICYQCDSTCATCSNIQNNCTSCDGSNYLYNNQCLTICPLAYYEDTPTHTCISCLSPCLLCSNTTCYYCETGSLLTVAGTCQNTCPPGFYNKSGICEPCQYNCSICDDSGCLNCANSTYLYNGQCLVDCPLQLYISITGDECQSCQSPCQTCQVNSNSCSS